MFLPHYTVHTLEVFRKTIRHVNKQRLWHTYR